MHLHWPCQWWRQCGQNAGVSQPLQQHPQLSDSFTNSLGQTLAGLHVRPDSPVFKGRHVCHWKWSLLSNCNFLSYPPVFRKMISTDTLKGFGWQKGDSHASYTTCSRYYECNSCVPLCKVILKGLHLSLKSYFPRGPQKFIKTKWNTLYRYLGILAAGKNTNANQHSHQEA